MENWRLGHVKNKIIGWESKLFVWIESNSLKNIFISWSSSWWTRGVNVVGQVQELVGIGWLEVKSVIYMHFSFPFSFLLFLLLGHLFLILTCTKEKVIKCTRQTFSFYVIIFKHLSKLDLICFTFQLFNSIILKGIQNAYTFP